ncbi:hypothetical protein GPALN_005856 [Globodera pallida]|nr:hypothetical protein GPALN_005856 [Globodera pallida]
MTEAMPSTPVTAKSSRVGRPIKFKGGPGRGNTLHSMSESSIIEDSFEQNEPMEVVEALKEVDPNLKLDDAPSTANNVNKIIDFNTVLMEFATTRNANCQIRRWAGIGLYADDSTSSGPRFIETCWNSPDEWLNDGFIGVYLAYLASISQRKVVVVDSLVSTPNTAVVRRSSFKNYTFGYDPNNAAEVILMPLNFPNHWTLLVYDVAFGTFFADSLHISRMDSARSELIKDIIVDIVPVERCSIVIENVNNLTPQQDGFSCGYFVCLYAEAWLMNQRTSDNVPYHPRAGVASPCPFVKRLEIGGVQSTSKFVEPNVQSDSDDSDDIIIVDAPAKEKKEEENIIFIDPPLHEQAVHPASTAMNAVLTQAELPETFKSVSL